MRQTSSIVLGAALFVAAVPAFAGIHYKSTTKSEDARGRGNEVQVEGWVSGEKARVEFKDSTSPNPVTQKGTYLLTQDGGKTLYLVNPEEKTYAVLDLNAVVSEQDFWTSTKLVDPGMGVWLRAQPPRTGNVEFDRLLTAERYKLQGYPLKMVTVTTNTDSKSGKANTSHSTMEVTQLETNATVPAGSFELPAGYKETQMVKPEGPRE